MNSVKLKMTKIVVYVFLSTFLAFVGISTQAAGSIKAGRDKAQMCATCHGLDGKSKVPEAPNLAGQIESYIVGQLRAFKSGERKNEQMSVIAQALSQQEIQDLAAYFSAIEVTVGKIPSD